MSDAERPIGIFDSGLGGLTVAAEVFRLLPAENVVYFGDVGRTPYGTRSKEIVIQFARQDVSFLLEQGVKLVVVACNTASATALDQLRRESEIDILGVIEPGARAAVSATRNGVVGVIGTNRTINSNSYARAIEKLDSKIRIMSMACPLFVPLVEEGYFDREASFLIAEEYLAPFKSSGIDTLVLGCTHYPILKPVIRRVLGDDMTLIDSANETAKIVRQYLEEKKLLAGSKAQGSRKFYVSDIPEQFANTARHFLGEIAQHVIRIDITKY